MAVIPPPLDLNHHHHHHHPHYSNGDDDSLLANLPSTILMHLSLEHLIPAFNEAQIDIFRLLMMKDPSDFVHVGIYNPDECRQLSQCVRSIQAHMSYKGLTVLATTPTTTGSSDFPPSSTAAAAANTSSSIYSHPVTTTNTSSSFNTTTTTTTSEQEQKNILRAIEAFDQYALPSFYTSSFSAWSRTSSSTSTSTTQSLPTPPPFSKLDHNKGKASVRSSFLSTFSDSTITATVEEQEEEEAFIRNFGDHHQEPPLTHHLDHPPPYPSSSSSSTPPPPSQQQQHSSHHQNNHASSSPITQPQQPITATPNSKQQTTREGRPGIVVPRQPRNLISRVPRPLSMPAYLIHRSSNNTATTTTEENNNNNNPRPASPASTIVSPQLPAPPRIPAAITTANNHRRSLIVLSSPPPDYLDTALMKRWEKCKSCIIPREEEGREELPPYKCTVYKMGHVYIKRELDSPGVRTRWRSWRKLYVEVWGTILRIYRAPPHGDHHGHRYRLLSRQPLLATRLPLSQWNRYYYSPLATISLAGAEAGRAWDYTKRPFSLRLTTAHGPQMLLRLSSHVEMISWIEHLQAAINISLDLEQRPMPKFMTLPSRAALTGSTMNARTLEIERAREQRRRTQREMLI
ncbi:hypothetical protein BDA99DRAFT_560191 [Phascolomyces articulosus]|uniref:PH domain-containing protein n=1 Tax=Phascolomyces articulosus TaxID=60185 RepID=A0AAD5K9I6_9FUNG|nr:hypothetical protein BDA99DRAFT_560191 [Phascolomyces articulosus]